MTPEDQTDALLDVLGRGELFDSRDPAARLLAALRKDVSRDALPLGDALLDEGGQRRSSVSMTPST
ncbi:hypothetical protein [Nonomuraea rhizosphaerae]|uniref:hypothetical protein n=1 Tax=Nonomuraea rhizosphaerae TaxID=2665663 RepID=UPI001C5F866E|nr:hypothetical protein [Nonomuraea rhizosphaerae]